jgi:DNA-binding CsgD family transcriptional regulator
MMEGVAGLVARMAVDMGERAGVSADELLEGLPFDRNALARRRRIDWDDYAVLLERLEALLGGPGAFHAVMERTYHQTLPPAGQSVLKGLVSPRLLYRTLMLGTESAWSNVIEHEMWDLTDNRIQLVARLSPGFRPCRAFFHGSIAAYAGAMGYLGRPPAKVKVLEVSERSMDIVLELPAASSSLSAASTLRRAGRALRELTRHSWGAPADSCFEDDAVDPIERELTQHFMPEPLGEAIVGVVASLGWSRIALHLQAVGRARPELVSARGSRSVSIADVVPLRSPHRMVGVLELGGSGDRARLDALLPRITLCLDAACTLSAVLAHALANRAVLERLRPRERETLACLVRGLSEKEAAASLALSPNTVHHYVRGLYRAFGVSTRTELLARFVSADLRC